MTDVERLRPAGMLEPRTDSWTAVVERVAKLATQIQQTDLVPKALRGKPDTIAAVILRGREIGLPPMTALATMYVVNGRAAMSAEGMRGLVLAAGHQIQYMEATGHTCTVRGRRRDTAAVGIIGADPVWHEVTWTLDMARQAGLMSNPTWKSYPRAMLKARATAELARDLFPDVIGGYAAVEEVDPSAAIDEPVDAGPTPTRARRPTTKRDTAVALPPARPPAPVSPAAPEPALPGEDDNAPLTGPQDAAGHQETEPDRLASDPASGSSPDPGAAENHPDGDPAAVGSRERRADAGTAARPNPPPWGEASIPETGTGTDIGPAAPDPGPSARPSDTASDAQERHVFALLKQLDVATRDDRLAVAQAVLQRRVQSFAELTRADAHKLIDVLSKLAQLDEAADPRARLSYLVDQGLALLHRAELPDADDDGPNEPRESTDEDNQHDPGFEEGNPG